jgi:2-amino-4-hydroxy-6-hydroxymethyldihydropteridine diphosphokinase
MVQLTPQFGKECFVALGGNLEGSLKAIESSILKIASHPEISNPESSSLYLTRPVSSIPQPDFLNSCLKFKTNLPPLQLFDLLEKIEIELGKSKKPKNAPRLIDIDFLFYGNEVLNYETLELPHPRWKERLFVLTPLNDLMDVEELLKSFENVHREEVKLLDHPLPYSKVAR